MNKTKLFSTFAFLSLSLPLSILVKADASLERTQRITELIQQHRESQNRQRFEDRQFSSYSPETETLRYAGYNPTTNQSVYESKNFGINDSSVGAAASTEVSEIKPVTNYTNQYINQRYASEFNQAYISISAGALTRNDTVTDKSYANNNYNYDDRFEYKNGSIASIAYGKNYSSSRLELEYFQTLVDINCWKGSTNDPNATSTSYARLDEGKHKMRGVMLNYYQDLGLFSELTLTPFFAFGVGYAESEFTGGNMNAKNEGLAYQFKLGINKELDPNSSVFLNYRFIHQDGFNHSSLDQGVSVSTRFNKVEINTLEAGIRFTF